jgi:hypothetical protein
MFKEVVVEEANEKIIEEWDFLEDRVAAKYSTFREFGQNIYGVRRRMVNRTEVVDLKKGKFSSLLLGPQGIVGTGRNPLHFHITTAGTPHRIPHSLGYWHINDMDELYLPVPGVGADDLGYFLVVMQTPKGNEGESFAWYCQRCVTMLYEVHYRSGELGLKTFWRAEENAVREYNRDVKNRTCPECGEINPLGYVWNTAKDTADESAARALW